LELHLGNKIMHVQVEQHGKGCSVYAKGGGSYLQIPNRTTLM